MCSKIIYLCLVFLLSFTGFVKGSCLEYGHSCWGAHGKRSGGKIYRPIDEGESQQSEPNRRDIPLTQDKLKPRELLSILLDRNARVNFDEARNPHDLTATNNENESMFDASEQRIRRKFKDAIRKGVIFHYLPKDFSGIISSTEASAVQRNQRPPVIANSGSDYYQGENYPAMNLDVEYLELK